MTGVLLQVGAWLVVAALLVGLLAVIYRYGADRDDPEWEWVSPGAVVAVILWVVASLLFAVYVTRFGSYNEAYGSLGAIVVVLLWLFITSTLTILGAELNTEMEQQTPVDTTTGTDRPMGSRGAKAADTSPDRIDD